VNFNKVIKLYIFKDKSFSKILISYINQNCTSITRARINILYLMQNNCWGLPNYISFVHTTEKLYKHFSVPPILVPPNRLYGIIRTSWLFRLTYLVQHYQKESMLDRSVWTVNLWIGGEGLSLSVQHVVCDTFR